jgi:hypothetical protein
MERSSPTGLSKTAGVPNGERTDTSELPKE